MPYRDVAALDVSGSSASKSRTEPAVLVVGLGLLGALLGLVVLGLVGLVLGALVFGSIGALIGTSAKSQTIVRLQWPEGELFFLVHEKSPDAVRIELSEPLRAIAAARTTPMTGSDQQPEPAPGSTTDQLSKLASLLQDGLLTRDEFDQLKAKVLAES